MVVFFEIFIRLLAVLTWKTSLLHRILSGLEHVKKQLQFLWSGPLVDHLFSPVFALTPAPVKSSGGKGLFFYCPPTLYLFSISHTKKLIFSRPYSGVLNYDKCGGSLEYVKGSLLIIDYAKVMPFTAE